MRSELKRRTNLAITTRRTSVEETANLKRAFECFRWNNFEAALIEFQNYERRAIAPIPYTNYYRAQTFLALGQYDKGFGELCRMRGKLPEPYKDRPLWRGQPNVPVIIVHEAGFGDGVQFMRYVREVAKYASSVALDLPVELQRLGSQLAPLVNDKTDGYVACWFDLMVLLKQTPLTVPPPPYLKPDPALIESWARRIGNGGRQRIGIVWETKFGAEENEAERRPIQIDKFLRLLPLEGELFSLQPQEQHGAIMRGVRAFELTDFADVAALASLMDVIVSVDTAAVHVVGAIEHPNAYVMLPFAATWRWVCGNWYPRLKICQQTFPGDWESAFAQIKRS
jgi:hypothetical protein